MAALAVAAACAAAPNESTTSAEVVIANRIIANRIIANRIIANRIIANRISDTRMTVNMDNAGELLSTEEGREVFSLIVSCAMPEFITLTATVDGTDFEFLGEIGLAPQWLNQQLDATGQRWVSACMFARVNAHEVAVAISLRGPSKALVADQDERAAWTLEEGAFYGNFFGRLDHPMQWFACRGRDKAKGDTGGLGDRDCAEPDPANPGFTLCGMFFAGDCGDFAADQACESFSKAGTFYQGCHSEPLDSGCGVAQAMDEIDQTDEGVADFGPKTKGKSDGRDKAVFGQVITSFVTP
jgi:hypothetical protein